MNIAVINFGSSSLKFKLFSMPSGKVLKSEVIEHIGERDSKIQTYEDALNILELDFNNIDAIGHRVVHGGEHFVKPTKIDDDVITTIKDLIALAPLHNPANLAGIEIFKKFAPSVVQIAVFDTAFHSTLSRSAYIYALPYEMYEKHHIRRYGFHGTSHSFIAKKAAKILDKNYEDVNLITLHLGNGASVCAIKNGKSIDTSMGFSPLEGLVMGSRSGDIDPAIVIYLQRELGFSYDEVDKILNKKSGLLGICSNNDLREILSSDDANSKLALEIMVRRIQKYIGAYMVLLEDVDAIVFSGGIGENSAPIRDMILDNKIIKNIKSLVVKTDEEFAKAQECYELLRD